MITDNSPGANKVRVKAKLGERFYQQQDHCLAQWELGKSPPANLVMGELPYAPVGKVGFRIEE